MMNRRAVIASSLVCALGASTAFAQGAFPDRPIRMVVHPSVEASDVKSLVELSRMNALKYGSSGNGTILHLAGEMLKASSGADLGFLDLSISLPQIKAGKLKVLATTGERRTAVLPDVLTVAESGYPGYAIGVWFAMFAPAGTPQGIVDKLNAETVAVLRDSALVAKSPADACHRSRCSTIGFRRSRPCQHRSFLPCRKFSGSASHCIARRVRRQRHAGWLECN